MTRRSWVAAMMLTACGTASTNQPQGESGGSLTTASSLTAGSGETSGTTDGTTAATTVSTTMDPTTGVAESSDDGVGTGPKFDVLIEGFCANRAADIYCSDNRAIECDGNGNEIDQENCDPDICLPGAGCVVCLDGQFSCLANKVLQCNTDAVPFWETVEVCLPQNNEGCDLATGSCQPLQPVGTDVPTGEYFQFADFQQGATAFNGGYDVDGFEDKLYVLNYSNQIDVYQVELEDSDGDGQLEPNQHPDNPDAMGEIETRTITYVETLPSFGTPSLSVSELFVLEDRMYIGGSQLTENVFGVGTSVVTTPPAWAYGFSQIGYDEQRGVWYASNESYRRVMQYDASDNSWGIAFYYPPLAGDHMDGMEVVTAPQTGITYVYVSDMTSDFIGQYRLHPTMGWVQENLFSYFGTVGVVVEGMGFGPLNHFWATGGNSVYELGGGDLAEFTDPPG
ncbi:MAG: hypothetical protein K1X88_22145 [Nannocystaceae bacterium]|nr:hypothetical protein [Nannocystaceae bacterium]